VFATNPEIVVVAPVPVIAPGLMVHVPVDGNPLKFTLPDATEQVGWVIVPTVGAVGAPGTGFITTFADGADVHPAALVTVKLYVVAERPVIVVLVPVPVTPPGLIVQVPVAGNPLKFTLPVATAQVGWVIAPAKGAVGVAG
jgi:hypothetical protein